MNLSYNLIQLHLYKTASSFALSLYVASPSSLAKAARITTMSLPGSRASVIPKFSVFVIPSMAMAMVAGAECCDSTEKTEERRSESNVSLKSFLNVPVGEWIEV